MTRSSTPLVMILTGDGKGKTTAAFGQALRAAGSGIPVAIVQFMKTPGCTGEVRALGRTDLPIVVEQVGRGFTIARPGEEPVALEPHAAAAREGLARARVHLSSGDVGLVVLDEVLTAIGAGLISADDVLLLLASRAEAVHVLLTGRNAPRRLVAVADLVSEVRMIRHHYTAGVAAQAGIEY